MQFYDCSLYLRFARELCTTNTNYVYIQFDSCSFLFIRGICDIWAEFLLSCIPTLPSFLLLVIYQPESVFSLLSLCPHSHSSNFLVDPFHFSGWIFLFSNLCLLFTHSFIHYSLAPPLLSLLSSILSFSAPFGKAPWSVGAPNLPKILHSIVSQCEFEFKTHFFIPHPQYVFEDKYW